MSTDAEMPMRVGRVTPCAPILTDGYHRQKSGGQKTARPANIRPALRDPRSSVIDLP
ncbi:MAG: hypothetical protein ABSB84_03885 [Verrucomicrobiota bacterium]|jgi:hypothetical protein